MRMKSLSYQDSFFYGIMQRISENLRYFFYKIDKRKNLHQKKNKKISKKTIYKHNYFMYKFSRPEAGSC